MSTRLSDYDFELPPELIAQQPANPRDSSRLLVLDRKSGQIEHRVFRDLPSILRPGDLCVANNTRVIKARLLGRRLLPEGAGFKEGGAVEFVLLERLASHEWEGLFKASVRAVPGVRFRIPLSGTPTPGDAIMGEITQGTSETGTVRARFDRDPVEAGAGELPLPPYIERKDAQAESNYQTVYGSRDGSAAAPTAGLHFTPTVLENLRARGVEWEELTLHVGIGTFRPVKSEDVSHHQMHAEAFEISAPVAKRLSAARNAGRRIIAVGTTSVRTLESVWDREQQKFIEGSGRTQIYIRPGAFEFRAVDALLTNFHLPRSSLILLVSAFAGRERILAAYAEAVREKYRFFSYGDAMLIL